MTLLKIKRTKTGDWQMADCGLCFSSRISAKRKFSDSSLASDAGSMKKISNWQGNLSDDSDSFRGSSPVGPAVLHSFKKPRIHSKSLYPYKYSPNDVCSPVSSIGSCGDTSCAGDMEELSSDADSSALSRDDADTTTLLRRKVGNQTLVVKWRGARPKANTSTLLKRKVGSYKLVVRCGGVRHQARIPHRSELKSYRRTLEEFYGNGALSWEQQGYLSELRSRLHISTDEHLNEVRKLSCLGSDLDALSVC